MLKLKIALVLIGLITAYWQRHRIAKFLDRTVVIAGAFFVIVVVAVVAKLAMSTSPTEPILSQTVAVPTLPAATPVPTPTESPTPQPQEMSGIAPSPVRRQIGRN